MKYLLFFSVIFLYSCQKKECQEPLIKSNGNISSVSITKPQLEPGLIQLKLQDPLKISDTYLSRYYSTSNYGTIPKIFCWAWTISGSNANGLFLLKFNYDGIPKGRQIESAHLTLYADTTNVFVGSPPPLIGHYGVNLDWSIKRIETDWDELLVQYNTRPIATDYHKVSLSSPTSSTSSYYNIDVTDLVKDQLQTNNFGFEVTFDNYTLYKRLAFYSSNSPNVNYIPKLDIVYK